jgi:hypothetical protein
MLLYSPRLAKLMKTGSITRADFSSQMLQLKFKLAPIDGDLYAPSHPLDLRGVKGIPSAYRLVMHCPKVAGDSGNRPAASPESM